MFLKDREDGHNSIVLCTKEKSSIGTGGLITSKEDKECNQLTSRDNLLHHSYNGVRKVAIRRGEIRITEFGRTQRKKRKDSS